MSLSRSKGLLPAHYVGPVAAVFSLRVRDHEQVFLEGGSVETCIDLLSRSLADKRCTAPVFCFLPDRLDVIVQGSSYDSRPLDALMLFRRRSAQALKKSHPGFEWLREEKAPPLKRSSDVATQRRAILGAPAREGLAVTGEAYKYAGAIGHELAGAAFCDR